jgi:hypothetical protein
MGSRELLPAQSARKKRWRGVGPVWPVSAQVGGFPGLACLVGFISLLG